MKTFFIAPIIALYALLALPAVAATEALPFESKASHYLLMDGDTGTVLAERQAGESMYPSSMTKLMTLYILFEELAAERLALDSRFLVSKEAWAKKGSKMFVPLNEEVLVEDLVRGISVQSGNDACIVVAEGLAGSEAAFAARMNETGKKLGMRGTNFVNASGWPDENHITTPHDLALLAQALINDFPQYYPYLAEREFTYNNIRQYNRNRLLGRAGLGVDGLKTGHTEAAGYGIVLAAKQPDGQRLILVINGLPSEKAREEEGASILRWGFTNFARVSVAEAGIEIGQAPVWLGKQKTVSLTVEKPLSLVVPRADSGNVTTEIILANKLSAPVSKGQHVAMLKVMGAGDAPIEVPLVAVHDVAKKGFFARIPDYVRALIGGGK